MCVLLLLKLGLTSVGRDVIVDHEVADGRSENRVRRMTLLIRERTGRGGVGVWMGMRMKWRQTERLRMWAKWGMWRMG